ncbi:conserved hypothetical protein [Talaromyces stipitatus ATCC 10500]|uniref:HTH CENPB-type domain-containing protein n=1 Tax=Talaromyces stipitatus (strain ATCC 10500 / CBS 375.48 / QM 6759 / NRRL 1006) TaxID=441959 RepID=B8MS06_TALSN|nr:uncharacterized protein TSTA_001230 [Talaromyces stipitatus ATCC 10500]EED12051.1 conserved hypothetical protein [Talaromyces stipitatus ATCC 10500]
MAPKEYKKEEEQIAKAVSAYQSGQNQNISRLAREFGVSRHRLSRRVKGIPSRSKRAPTNRLLSLDQEKALFLWIEYLDNIGAPPTNQQIEQSANFLLREDFTGPGEPRGVGKTWVDRFLTRLPEGYQRIKQKPQEVDRTGAEHYGEIERWFIDLKLVMQKLHITPKNLWNFDETGFIVGQGKSESVVTKYPKTAKRVSSLSSRESLTVVESINAEGRDPEWLIAPASNGFITDEIAFEWLQHFQHYTKPEHTFEWRLLIMDNHTTHLTIQFVQYCEINRIRLFRFPPHSTHLLQPLDGVPFQQYKRVHGRVVNQVARLGGFDFNKNDFFEELRDIRIQTFTPRIIRHGWKDRGIWPYNPDIVLSKLPHPDEAIIDDGNTLKIYGEVDDTIPSSPTTKSISPPSTVTALRRYINKIEKSIEGIKDILEESKPGLVRRIKVVNSSSLAMAGLGELHREDFARLRDTAKRKNNKKTKRQVKASGALYVKDANRLIKRRHDGDLLRIHKQHVLGVPEAEDAEAPREPQNLGFFIDSTGNR